jgi:hypothetical protein
MGPILGFEKLHVSFRGNLIRYVIFLIFLSVAPIVQAQNVVDPGPRGTPVGAGGHIANLSSGGKRPRSDVQRRFLRHLPFAARDWRHKPKLGCISVRWAESPGCAGSREPWPEPSANSAILCDGRGTRARGAL